MTPPVCDLCKSELYHVAYDLNDFRILRCQSCQLVYRWPMPTDEELFEMYNQPIEDTEESLQLYYKDHLKQTYMRMFQKLRQVHFLHTDSVILDVGTGHGWSYEVIKNLGHQPIGMDIDMEDLIHANHEGPTIQGWSESIPLRANSVNAILSTDVLEHVRNPRAVLNECYRVLEPNGVLLLRIPDAYSVLLRSMDFAYSLSYGQMKSIGRRLYRYHLFGFGIQSITRYLQECGFTVLTHYRESSKNLNQLNQKSWAANPLIRYGIISLTHIGEFIGRQDELILISQRNSLR